MNLLMRGLRSLPPRLSERLFYRCLYARKANRAAGESVVCPLRRPFGEVQMDVVRGDVISDAIYWTGQYEATASRAMAAIAREEGGLLVDVGANLGYFSLLWCSSSPGNRAISIEASPPNAERLRSNIRLNSLEEACEVKSVAVSSLVGEVSFDLGPRDQTGWGGISEGVGSGTRVVTLPCDRLDRLVPEDLPVRLLKIDVEGAEALVLESADGLFARRQVAEVWFEDNAPRREALGIEAADITASLARNGYRIDTAAANPSLPTDCVAYRPEELA